MGKKNNRMGSSLDDLFADNFFSKESGEQKDTQQDRSITKVRLSLLEPNKDQPRENFDEEKLQELADSISENGLIQPIAVRPLENGGYQIVAGERRWRASRMAGLEEVPVYILDLDDKQTMQLALIENIQRQDLSPIEEAEAYKKLMTAYGMTQEETAKVVGKSRSAVANSVRLLSLCDEVKKMVNDGILSSGHAKVLASLEEPDQIELAAMTEDMSLTVRELEALAAQAGKPKTPYNEKEMEKLRRESVKKPKPFLKEFEVSVNGHSNIKVKTKSEKDGGAQVTLKIGKEQDIEVVLARLAEMLAEY